ncbi:MAG: Asp-tRNA(Asn)/Glu-tRNA(Gln) amidotransferase subunit GatC [Eubacteriales bacterium]
MIKKSDVEHVALLARLELADIEKEIYTKQLNDILGHFESLQQLETTDVEPMAHVLSLFNVFREDKVDRHLSSESVLANCPDRDEDCFKVPKIV